MTIKEIENLVEQGEYEAAYNAAGEYLAANPADAGAMYLKARSLFEWSMRAESEAQSEELVVKAYDAFSDVLQADPQHREALEYRAYTGAVSGYITDKEDAVMADLAQLLETGADADKLRYLNWRSTIHMREMRYPESVADMEQIIAIAPSAFPTDQPARNEVLARAWFGIGEVKQHQLNDAPAALEAYKKAYSYSMFQRDYLQAAALALELKDYDFAGELIDVLPVVLGQGEEAYTELLLQVKQLFEEGPLLPIAIMYCKATASVPAVMLAVDEQDVVLEQISLGKKMMQLFPEERYFAHYTGKAFFEVQQYAAAIPYLQKAVAGKDPHPMAIARWCYAQYKATGVFPDSMEWPESDYYFPYDWYQAGWALGEWEADGNATLEPLLLMKKFLYGKGLEQYKAYWTDNAGASSAHHNTHYAVCCYNQGLTLHHLEAYDAAIEVYTTGYAMLPFWQQLNSRALAYCDAGQFENSVADLVALLEEYGHVLDAAHTVFTYHRLIHICGGNMRDHKKALEWYERFMEVYENGLAADIDNLPADEREPVIENVNSIKTSRGLITSETDDLPARIAMLEKHLIEFPDDAGGYFNLMQLYYQNGQYEHAAGSATSRISIGDGIPLEDHIKIYFYRSMAYQQLNKHEKAVEDLLLCEKLVLNNPQADSGHIFHIYGKLGALALEMGNNTGAIDWAGRSVAMAERNRWSWDEVVADYCYTLAFALKNEGRVKEALQKLRLIVKKYPSHELAAEKIKEWKPWWDFMG